MYFIGSQKQDIMTQPSAEAEYIAVCAAANQTIWLRRILSEMGAIQKQSIKIFCDSKSAISVKRLKFSIERLNILKLNIILFEKLKMKEKSV